ncbi:hypothetical protein NQ317_006303 [Molorchus minor]|uniref:Uncharacterized protein n=1 Tax=Molorchus minor TaxID=1323400 RepID=A0ABQ9JJK3_9CUCU|nr:hypothetical protein NQ317_006303 [Molorchus minor]
MYLYYASYYAGDSCETSKGSPGVCKFLTQCPSALAGLQRGQLPKNCGFRGTQVIVCCSDIGTPTGTTTTTTTTRRTPTTPTSPTTTSNSIALTNRLPGDISKLKQSSTFSMMVTITFRCVRRNRVAEIRIGVEGRQRVQKGKQDTEVSGQSLQLVASYDRQELTCIFLECKEYAQYAYDRTASPVLSLVPQYANTLECPFEKLPLIVGGTSATRQEFPHMALIGYQTGEEIEWACGGTLISENFVLTAGHCLKDRKLGSAKFVRLGITNKTDHTHMQELTVKDIISHPEYTSAKYHDIGLLKLSKNAQLDPYVRPACLQTQRNIPYKNAIASGWGKIEFSGGTSDDLLKVVLEFFTTEQCNKTYRRDINGPTTDLRQGILDDYMLCAGSSKDFKDTCQGDSGGPLQVYHEETNDIKCMYDIVGVTSFGKSCGLAANVPGVYTRGDSGGPLQVYHENTEETPCMYDIVGVTSFGKSCGLAKDVPGVYTRVSWYTKWIEDIVWPE